MEAILKNGDYIENGRGGIQTASLHDALLQRALFKLQARRGSFPLLPLLGSRLYTLPRIRRAEQEAAARQFSAEALSGEPLEVTGVEITESGEGQVAVAVRLSLTDDGLSAEVNVNF